MHLRALSIAIALTGCSSTSGMSEPSKPRASCPECQMVGTYVSIALTSGWSGECWKTYDASGPCSDGPLPTPGGKCKEEKSACKTVAHDITVRCPDDRCRVGESGPFPANGYEFIYDKRRDITVTKAGSFTMDVEFKPRSGGSGRVEHVPVTAVAPDGVRAVCTYDGSDALQVELTSGEMTFVGRYTDLAVTLAGRGPCARLATDPTGRGKNIYRCTWPVKGATVEVSQPDFTKTVEVTCS